MAGVIGVIVVVAFLVFAAWLALVTMYGDEREAAKAAIREAYERGDMGPEQYAVAMRALDEAA